MILRLSHTLHPSPDGTTWSRSIIRTSNLIHPILYPSPGPENSTSTSSIVWIPLIGLILSHPILSSLKYVSLEVVWILFFWPSYHTFFIRLQAVSQLDQLFKYPLIWSSYPTGILFICLQRVREISQLFEYLPSDLLPFIFIHLQNVRVLCQLFKTSNLSSQTILSSRYAYLVKLFESPPSDRLIPSSSSVSRKYVNFINWFKASDYLILFIHLQHVREPQSFEHPSFDHPLHPSPDRTWTWSVVSGPLIWSSYPILFIRLQKVRELG